METDEASVVSSVFYAIKMVVNDRRDADYAIKRVVYDKDIKG